jgi:hypothetical protein
MRRIWPGKRKVRGARYAQQVVYDEVPEFLKAAHERVIPPEELEGLRAALIESLGSCRPEVRSAPVTGVYAAGSADREDDPQ